MRSQPWLVIGVDGGGSRSEARLWSGEAEIARSTGGPLNPNHAGVATSGKSLEGLLSELRMRKSGVSERLMVEAACVGLSGISHPASRGIVRAAFETAGVGVAGPRILVSDAEIVLEEAFGPAAPSGVALIAGTGSIALARDAAGNLVRAGGSGPDRGDEGGGHWVGREALAAGWADGTATEPGGIADVARAVTTKARQGDPRALAILRRAAAELAGLVRSAAQGASLGEPFQVRVSGGLAGNSPELLAGLADELSRIAPSARLGPIVSDPVHGALRLATRMMSCPEDVPPGW